MITPRVSVCLWFQSDAEAAARRYCELIPGSRVVDVLHHGPGGALPEGTEMLVTVELSGSLIWLLNGGPHFKLNEAASIVVRCETQAEIDRLWDALLEGGQTMACGWLTDRWGVSWQIIPAQLDGWMHGDPAKTARMMQALFGMLKLDIAALQRAYDG